MRVLLRAGLAAFLWLRASPSRVPSAQPEADSLRAGADTTRRPRPSPTPTPFRPLAHIPLPPYDLFWTGTAHDPYNQTTRSRATSRSLGPEHRLPHVLHPPAQSETFRSAGCEPQRRAG